MLGSCGRDGTVRLWDTRSGAELAKDVTGRRFTRRSGFVSTTKRKSPRPDATVICVSGKVAISHRTSQSICTSDAVSALSWIGSRIFSASEDGTVRILDLEETKWNSRAHQFIGVTLSNPSPKTSE